MSQERPVDCQSFAKGAQAMLNELAVELTPEKQREAQQWIVDVVLWSNRCEIPPLPSEWKTG